MVVVSVEVVSVVAVSFVVVGLRSVSIVCRICSVLLSLAPPSLPSFLLLDDAPDVCLAHHIGIHLSNALIPEYALHAEVKPILPTVWNFICFKLAFVSHGPLGKVVRQECCSTRIELPIRSEGYGGGSGRCLVFVVDCKFSRIHI